MFLVTRLNIGSIAFVVIGDPNAQELKQSSSC